MKELGMSEVRPWIQLMAGFQWLGFMFANTVVIPLSVGHAFGMSAGAISGAMTRSFLITGIACLVQASLGHKLPLMEGQSGLWWGVILGLASLSTSSGLTLASIGGSVATGMMIGGILITVCGFLGMHRVLIRLFTPIVMAVLLTLLAAQLIDIFFKGMVGLEQGNHVLLPVASLSLVIVLLVSVLSVGSKGLLSNFAILIGLVTGWIAYALLFGPVQGASVPTWREVSQVFAWGTPTFHTGIILTCVLTALLNTTNTVATLRAAEPLFNQPSTNDQYQRSLIWSGLFTAVSGPLALVGYIPYTSSIGFLRATRLLDRTPFFIGALLFTCMGLVPSLTGFFSTLPVPVGDAVLFVAYLQLFGAALQSLEGFRFNVRTVYRVAAPILLGLAIQSTPANAFSTLPGLIQSILSNGMLVGILVSICMETFIRWEKWSD